MDKGSTNRRGKVVSGGHSTLVEGLSALLRRLEQWPEITSIRLGPINHSNPVGRKSKRLKPGSSNEGGLRPVQGHKRAKGGGGFNFKATRLAMVGQRVTGILCHASHGTCTQLVVLCGGDLGALKSRLHAEGFGANW